MDDYTLHGGAGDSVHTFHEERILVYKQREVAKKHLLQQDLHAQPFLRDDKGGRAGGVGGRVFCLSVVVVLIVCVLLCLVLVCGSQPRVGPPKPNHDCVRFLNCTEIDWRGRRVGEERC